ncbi:FAR1-related sequence 5-like protein, partial [Tanacetum coccineum]
SLDEAFEFYSNYAKKSRFEPRRSTENKEPTGKRVTTSKRTGFEARIILKLNRKKKMYEVVEFEEEHNHSMVHKDDSHFLNSQRQLNFCQKQTLMDVGNLNMGPRKGFKVLKQARVGEKKELLPDFSYEFMQGEDKKLSGLFWADETAKRNYIAFGDIVGFDATFRTNKYFMVFVPFTGIDNHKRCVTFGAGLLSKENVESYEWLLKSFKKTMSHEPKLLVTDQDASIKIAIPRVFTTAKQRLCMWHITEKFGDKFGSTLCKSGFLERINDIVWSKTLTPEQFELKWASLMNEYDQQEHKWLSDMYDIRDSWIPSYFCDLPLAALMQTTSRCEGENYFFGLLTNTDLYLVEFINHFETAMDAQRNIQRNNDHDSWYKAPQLRTSFQFEKEAAEIFTVAAFKVIQAQILKSMLFCMSYNVTDIEGGKRYFIKDVDDDVDFVESEINEYPKRYILRRWTKDVIPPLSYGSCFNNHEISEKKDEIQALIRESVFFLESAVDRLVNDVSKLSDFRNKQKELMEQEIEIGNPNISSNKGGVGGKKRLISLKDKAIAKSQKTNLRRCNYCEEYVNHDSCNCPVKKKDQEDQRKKSEEQKKRTRSHQSSTSGPKD